MQHWVEFILIINKGCMVIRLDSKKAFGEPLVFQISTLPLPTVDQIQKKTHFPEHFSKGFS